MTFQDIDIGRCVEAVVISRGKIDDQLKEFVVFVEFEIIFEKGGVSLGLAGNQLTE